MNNDTFAMKPIATIYTDFPTKFGLPRQSLQTDGLIGRIVFEEEYRNVQAIRGLEDFSHLWIIWCFSESVQHEWSPTVRPPRLGGNKRMGVFATRSPFRPNPLGLSCVKIKKIDLNDLNAPVLYVSGIDMMNGTPIFDIKPYLPYADCVPDALGGFGSQQLNQRLDVTFYNGCDCILNEEQKNILISVLQQDPRPHYQHDETRIYGFPFAGYEVKFKVYENRLLVIDIIVQ